MNRDKGAYEDFFNNSLIIFWKQRWKCAFIYKGLKSHNWGTREDIGTLMHIVHLSFWFYGFSALFVSTPIGTFCIKIHIFKDTILLSSCTVTDMYGPSKSVGLKLKANVWFKVLQWAWNKVPQWALSKAFVSSRAVLRQMTHSTCREGRRSQTDFPKYWPQTYHGGDVALRERKDRKGQ